MCYDSPASEYSVDGIGPTTVRKVHYICITRRAGRTYLLFFWRIYEKKYIVTL